MTNKIIFSIARKLLSWAVSYVYDYVDKNDDGKLSKQELESVYTDFKALMKKLK